METHTAIVKTLDETPATSTSGLRLSPGSQGQNPRKETRTAREVSLKPSWVWINKIRVQQPTANPLLTRYWAGSRMDAGPVFQAPALAPWGHRVESWRTDPT
ncbi:hypothetical protein AAY473_024524 [Plecturocebus cupreus]